MAEAGHSKQHGLGSTADHSSATTAQINALVSDGVLTATLDNTIYVSKTGNDSNSGTLENPFLTIKAAVDSITDNSSSNPYVVLVAPGVYSESAITMKAYVDVRSMAGPWATFVTPSAVGNTMFTSTGENILEGFTLSGATSGKAYLQSGTTYEIIRNCIIYNCATGIECTGGELLATDIATINSGSMTTLILGNAGNIRCNNLFVPSGCTITNVVSGANASSNVTIVGFEILSSNVTTAIHCNTGSFVDAKSGFIEGATNGAYALGTSSELKLSNTHTRSCTNALRVANTSTLELDSVHTENSVTYDILVDTSTAIIDAVGCHFDRTKLSFPSGYSNDLMFFQDDRTDDQAHACFGEFAVGRPERGSETIMGEGDSYTRNMVVISTDSTATSTTDGGNLTDESADAASATGSTFSFQGTAANHTILIGSNLSDGTDQLKHWGIKVAQTTAAVEVSIKSFAFEYWDGTNWTEFQVMATDSSTFDNYGNVLFIRANNTEHIRYGLTEDDIGSDWTKKTIDSKNLYWVRIRITTGLTTAPVFEQFKLHSSRFEANETGKNTYHGKARFRVSLAAAANAFGEEGGILDVNLSVGSGGVPTGWTHNILNSELGGNGDAVHYQYVLPKGLDTSLPLYVDCVLAPETTATTQAISMIASVKPAEVTGVLVADPSGGTTPTARTEANTDLVTNAAAQTDTLTVNDTTVGKPFLLNFGPFDVSDYYEGDLIFIRLEMDDDGASNNDLYVLGVGLTGVKWNHGGAL